MNIKIAGENMILDVLAIPFGSEMEKDADNEYFTAETDLSLSTFRPIDFISPWEQPRSG